MHVPRIMRVVGMIPPWDRSNHASASMVHSLRCRATAVSNPAAPLPGRIEVQADEKIRAMAIRHCNPLVDGHGDVVRASHHDLPSLARSNG